MPVHPSFGDKLICRNRDRQLLSRMSGCVPATGLMYSNLFYSLTVGFVGAILFLLVDKYEPEGRLARLMKLLILFVAGVAILHKLHPYGFALF
jgi:hypothetical protein